MGVAWVPLGGLLAHLGGGLLTANRLVREGAWVRRNHVTNPWAPPKLFMPQPEGLFLCGETEAQVTLCPGGSRDAQVE